MLASHASFLLAVKDDKWNLKDIENRTKSTVFISPENLSRYFSKRKIYDDKIKKHSRFHQILEVNYEEMSVNPDQTFSMVQDFLETDILNLEISLVKQEIRPLSEVI